MLITILTLKHSSGFASVDRHPLKCNCHRTLGGSGAFVDHLMRRGGKAEASEGERSAQHIGIYLSYGVFLRRLSRGVRGLRQSRSVWMACKESGWHSSNNSPRNPSSPPGSWEDGDAGRIMMKCFNQARPLPTSLSA